MADGHHVGEAPSVHNDMRSVCKFGGDGQAEERLESSPLKVGRHED